MPRTVLEVESLHVTLPPGSERDHAVRDLHFDLRGGRILCVVGESGAGKSALAQAVMGLLPRGLRATGSVRLLGESLLDASPQRLRRLRGSAMGMVFQDPLAALNPVMRCGDQVDEVLRVHTDWSAERRRAEVRAMFEKVHLTDPERMMRSHPHQLSGGQRQRVAIAMAAILSPPLLICDEPTSALDVATQGEVLRLLRRLRDEHGSAVLLITHDMRVVDAIADDVLVLHRGSIVEQGPREEVMRHPASPCTRRLIEAVPSMRPHPMVPMAAASAVGPPLLRADALARTHIVREGFGRRELKALRGVSLAVAAGRSIGIVGESGSGKTTLARCLLRLIEPSAGRVLWQDTDVTRLPERRLRPHRRLVQAVFQDSGRSLDPRRSIGASIVEGAINFGMPRMRARHLAAEWMERLNLPIDTLQRHPAQLSGGQRQRVAIARALACHPAVLVADEPVSSLDTPVQQQILELLRDIQRQMGLGMLLITHDLRVAASLCDEIVVLHDGLVVEHGHTTMVCTRPRHPLTRRLFGPMAGESPAA